MNKIQEELVVNNDRMVHYFVRKMMTRNVKKYEYDDLVQIGRIGLIKAAKTFNGSVKFITYASRCINNELLMFLRKENKRADCLSLEEPVTSDIEGNEFTLGDVTEYPNSDFSKLVMELSEIENTFNIVLNVFDTREILIWLYSTMGMKQESMASIFGVTQSCISRLRVGIYSKINKLVDKNFVFPEMYHVRVLTDGSSISFSVQNINRIDDLILGLMEDSENFSKIKIARKLENVTIFFSNLDVALPAIASLISIVNEKSISLVRKNSKMV